jgi:hypothetical protein
MKHIKIIIFIFLLLFTACKQEYLPPVNDTQQSSLVVEGNLNAGADSTFIRLTRSQALNSSAAVEPVNSALLTVEGKDNSVRSLTGTGNGYYVSPNLNILIGQEYRLRIKTTNGKEYLSDYVIAKATPAIDSVGWYRNEDGVKIYVNTADPANATRYYRWEYEETWEIRSPYRSNVIYENGNIRNRVFPQEDIQTCWKNNNSTSIIIGNTTRLQQDVVHEQQVVFISTGDEKLSQRYSILVKQFALDADSYAFYDLLKKNTEDIGSIFSPQPTEIKGNLQCLTNPDELVIGYITASTVTTRRIFISATEVPEWRFFIFCMEIRIPNHRDSIADAVRGGLIPVYYTGSPPNQYIFSTPVCVDCTSRGGGKTKPPFW